MNYWSKVICNEADLILTPHVQVSYGILCYVTTLTHWIQTNN